MKNQVGLAIACAVGLICIQQGLCVGEDEHPTTTDLNNWTCTCASPFQRNESYVKSNCSGSCDCSPAAGPSDIIWNCKCAAEGFPKVVADNHDTTCFTACNCTTGPVEEALASRNHTSSRRIVVIILLLCVVFATLAFVAAITCYVYQKDKCPVQASVFSPDRETSCNSATNLISHRASSVSESKVSIYFPANSFSGCFGKPSLLYRSKAEIIHGTVINFSYSELEYATDKFSHSNLIGLGGSSYVYRGMLKDGRTVAVKRLKAQEGPDVDSVFLTEVGLLSRLHHCHVVPLIGYCSELFGRNSERLLVFEYMPNGNLRDSLDGSLGENINWETRVAIAIGAARGLEYLHEAAAPRILHRDVKSTNILLDKNWRAKITDLGMAKHLRDDGVPSSSSSPARMQGTFGYFAPEYAMIGRASLMSDVFSFGVVLLELITGRHPILETTTKGEESLVLWATPYLQNSKRVTTELPDPRLKGNFREEELQIMAYLAKECLLLDPDARPTMSEVVQILSTISPDKTRRRNIPVNLFQMSPISSTKTGFPLEVDNEALDFDHSVVKREAVAETVSTEHMERLILLTSKARSWRATDDEAVDLMEPRLESFCMVNLGSP
ncbi:hypothetical protein K2173_016537 [Erythroxylum novogranatense]|uniref:non-specific serine/threonine protein kinase n=1 Tax=Erythroxylum novogranatense TaxID=1862640 RepID=A0AAV8SGH1_9ROSI|nr:hypothetical protein K2173_016537 [Erythroxylum novogranatense]